MSRSQAGKSVKTDFPGDLAAIISISDPGKPKPTLDSSFDETLFLAFSDTNDEIFVESTAANDISEIAKIVHFIDRIHGSEIIYSLVVHCNFGLSRSCAVARYAAKATGANVYNRDYGGNPRDGSRAIYNALITAAQLNRK